MLWFQVSSQGVQAPPVHQPREEVGMEISNPPFPSGHQTPLHSKSEGKSRVLENIQEDHWLKVKAIEMPH